MTPAPAIALSSGAEARWTNRGGAQAVVLIDGGRAQPVAGTWSATLEWLVARLAPQFHELGFVDVKYRLKSWHRLDMCVEDASSALELAVAEGARSCALVGFSMGGAVAVRAAVHPAVKTVVGLAPWLPEQLDLSPLRGRRFAVIHGALDGRFPGLLGVRAGRSEEAFRRAQRIGVLDADYTLIPGGVHGVALRSRQGLVRLPRANRWLALLALELERFSLARRDGDARERGETIAR